MSAGLGDSKASAASHGRAAELHLRAEYRPDDKAQARALLLIAGLPEDEIERIVSEITLESNLEM